MLFRAIEPQLRAAGQQAALVIATDGESSDGDVVAALRPLASLPVFVSVRLCTGLCLCLQLRLWLYDFS